MALIGGFFGIELPPATSAGLAASWAMPSDPAHTFANARSALAALLLREKPSTLWLPAYICPSIAAAAEHSGTSVRYFPVDESLEPDTAFIDTAARRGDMVLAVDYFGRPPEPGFRRFLANRPDLRFIEDAAQALATGLPGWGHWRMHSPRKLVGVPDGGFIVPWTTAPSATSDAPGEEHALATSRAAWLRFEDESESRSGVWHSANQAREAAETVSAKPMSRLSRELLERLGGERISQRRRANYRALASRLEPIMLFSGSDPQYAPSGFVIRLSPEVRSSVREALIEAGIFPAIHWEALPSPQSFTVAHRLAAELLTLPCDQRYTPAEMQPMADIVSSVLARR